MESFAEIGNSIVKFVYVDPWCRGEKDKRIAWILIEKAYKGGYPYHIEIAWGCTRIKQRLDLWGIPFRCSSCHRTWHLIKNYRRHAIPKTRLVHRRIWVDPSLPLAEKLSSSSVSLSAIDPIDEQTLKGLQPSLTHRLSPPDLSFGTDIRQTTPAKPVCLDINRSSSNFCTPILEPSDEKVVPSPLPMQLKDFIIGSHSIMISASSLKLDKNICPSFKGKEPWMATTPFNSP